MIEDEGQTFRVVTNHEEQYSIWPEERDLPAGWVAVGPTGSKSDCLDYIEHVWTDMRPRSLRLEERDAPTKTDRSVEAERNTDGELQALVSGTLSQHEDRLDEYAGGRPELFGWFLARVLEAGETDEADPDAVRAELDRQLPHVH